MARNKRPEQIIQQGVFSQLSTLMYLQKYQQFIAFQIRNETGVAGSSGLILGKISKSMGTMKGVSDTVFLFPSRKEQILISAEKRCGGEYFKTTWKNIPEKTVFLEFKAYKPLKTKERCPESLLSEEQKIFKERVNNLGFEYHIVAAQDIDDALKQVYLILRDNGVNV